MENLKKFKHFDVPFVVDCREHFYDLRIFSRLDKFSLHRSSRYLKQVFNRIMIELLVKNKHLNIYSFYIADKPLAMSE